MEPGSNTLLTDLIAKNLEAVRKKIDAAAQKADRDPALIKLVVVTKRRPLEVVRAAMACGVQCFGENYPEEGAEKSIALGDHREIEWHMIGHVQSRKANLVCDHYQFLHSLDSLKLAYHLESHLAGINRVLPVLLEVNISGEESKHGFLADALEKWDQLIPEMEEISQLPHLKIAGLMTMPPLFEDPENVRPIYKKISVLRQFLLDKLPHLNLKDLSMGTSADYPIAVEEGATILRVGEAILGPRSR